MLSTKRITAIFLTSALEVLVLLTPALAQQDPAKPAALDLAARGTVIEDWSSLALENSKLHPEAPLVAEKDEESQFTRELLQLKWRTGDPIDLYVIQPKSVKRPPVVLYLYSYPSETDRFRDNKYCERITSGGFAAIGFVSALTGQRYSNRPMKQWFVSELQEALGSSVHDVQMILNYLATRDDLDLNRVGIFGAGSGGTIAILAASADPRIQVIDVLDPWGDWPEWVRTSAIIPEEERPSFQKTEFLQRVAPLDPVLCLPRLRSQHMRIQQLANDPVTTKKAQERIDSAVPATAQLSRYEGDTQLFAGSSGGRLFQWIKSQLDSLKKPQPPAADLRVSRSFEEIAPSHPAVTQHSENQ